MTVSDLDMIYIESILKTSSSVDVTLRSVRAETSTNQQSSRPPSQLSLPSSQHNHVVEVAVSSSAAETASTSATAGRNKITNDCLHLYVINHRNHFIGLCGDTYCSYTFTFIFE